MKSILEMGREEILALTTQDPPELLTAGEVMHIATILGAFWTYDYVAASEGRVGLHALLKSGLHSDGFLVSRILLEPVNILLMMANQIAIRYRDIGGLSPDWVAGVPDGATMLGRAVAKILGARSAEIVKVDGRIFPVSSLGPDDKLLLVEDFCTRGTGFKEAVIEVKRQSPETTVLPYNPVIVNRGGMQTISVDGIGEFTVLPIVERRIQDWDPNIRCDLCSLGSTAIKPKATDENWRQLVTSQLP